MIFHLKTVLYCLLIFFALATPTRHQPPLKDSWCDKPLWPGLEKLKGIKTQRHWFRVYDVGNHTFAIDEPYNWEETIAYLIVGKDRALLFDTGMGLDSISLVVKEVTSLPVIVLNSHTHPDHIGGNSEFSQVLAMNTAYTKKNAANGYSHDAVKWEVSPASVCLDHLPKKDTAHYHVSPFRVTRFVGDGYRIDLGGRTLQVIATPGHTPDAICLYEQRSGYFWCGDSFYEGPILLSAPETDLKSYAKSIKRMARFARTCKRILPAHNLPVADPALLVEASRDFGAILAGSKKGKPGDNHSLVFDCGRFSYQIGQKFLP